MLIRNLRPFAVEIPDVGDVEAGATIDIPDDLANGIPPTADHPGTSGYLAQTDAWATSTTKKTATAAEDVSP